MSDITLILECAERGDPRAAEELLPLVYDELRKLAARKLAAESPGHTLQPTALVHEAWLHRRDELRCGNHRRFFRRRQVRARHAHRTAD